MYQILGCSCTFASLSPEFLSPLSLAEQFIFCNPLECFTPLTLSCSNYILSVEARYPSPSILWELQGRTQFSEIQFSLHSLFPEMFPEWEGQIVSCPFDMWGSRRGQCWVEDVIARQDTESNTELLSGSVPSLPSC